MQTSAPGPIGATDQTQRLRRFRAGYYSASKHSAGKPIVAGWSYQWITQLGWANDSWTAPMDARRIAPTENTTQATATQIRDLLARLDEHEPEPMFVFDAGYDPIALTHELAEVPAAIVVRIRDDRVFYTDPTPPAPGTRGRRRRHGDRVKLTDPTTWPAPDHKSAATDPHLKESGAITDEHILDLAKSLLEQADPQGAKIGKYNIDVRGAHNVLIGDHGTQHIGRP